LLSRRLGLFGALAATALLGGCVIEQRSRGVLPQESLPPPPSEPGAKSAGAGPTQGSPPEAPARPERKPLAVAPR
jgi:hypothetical protein